MNLNHTLNTRRRSPELEDGTMFPDLWTSSNLLKITFNLSERGEQQVRGQHPTGLTSDSCVCVCDRSALYCSRPTVTVAGLFC